MSDLQETTAPNDQASRSRREQTLLRLRRLMFVVYALDVAVLSVVLVAAWQLRVHLDLWMKDVAPAVYLATALGPWIVLTWLVAIAAQGGYSLRQFGAGADEFRSVTTASIITAGALGMFCYLFQVPLPRGFVFLVFLLGTPLLLLERYAVRKAVHALRVRGRLCRRVIAVGGPAGIREVVDVLEREKYVGYDVVGACLPADGSADGAELTVPVLGTPDEIRDVCDRTGSDTVLIARGGYASAEEMRRVAWSLENTDIDMVVVPSLTDIAGPRISMRPVAGLPLLHVEPPQSGRAGGLPKRTFDIVVSSAILLLLSPVLLVIAVLVKAHDGGPVVFRQPRIGRGGEAFPMLKFRSMVVDAEDRRDELEDLNESEGPLFKIRDDPRVTRLGRFMRRYSIDEIPQLLNVLRGQMSLVGPRPPLPSEVDRYGRDVHRRLAVRPGMTGLWQVSGRSELSWNEAVRLDLYYVDNWSLMTDLVIMAKTVRAVLRSSGAY